jgi:hypothetical protein
MELEESKRAAIETRLLAVEPALIFGLARGGADTKSSTLALLPIQELSERDNLWTVQVFTELSLR